MSWFSRAASFCSGVVSRVKETVSSAMGWAREKATQAMDYVADRGEQFIDSVKSTYQAVKPFLKKARPWIDRIGDIAGVPFPWLKPAISVIGVAVDGLLALENSPVAHALEKALRGVIKIAKFTKGRYLSEEEVVQAKQNKKALKRADELHLTSEQQDAINLSILLNNYSIIKKELRDLLEEGVTDFQQYLRLRAVQKLLDMAESKLTQTTTLSDITKDDIFLINIGEQLLNSEEMTERDALRLDDIIRQRVGKKLIPFVFEELMLVWVDKQVKLEADWNACRKEVSQLNAVRTRLESSKKIQALGADDQKIYDETMAKLGGQRFKLERLERENRSMENYVYAAEAFMQLLEKDEKELIAEDKEYLIEDSPEIANIIMKVATHNIEWETLSEEERDLITDFAAIFKLEGRQRAKELHNQMENGIVEVAL